MKQASTICKAARTKAGLSQAELARLAHCTRNTIINIESGAHQPAYLLMRTIESVCERRAAQND